MDIRYDLTVEDYIAFADYHHSHSTVTGGIVRRWRYGATIAWLVAALIDTALNGFGFGTVFWAGGALLWYSLLPRFNRWGLRRNMRRYATQGLCRGSIGPHTLSITPDGLTDRTPTFEYRTFWRGVDRVVTTQTHIYVYLGPNAAHILPRRAFSSSEQETAFLSALELHPTGAAA